jgi:hypothetical protein
MATYNIDEVVVADLVANDIINCDYSGEAKELELFQGIYKLECWGAQGGHGNPIDNIGGKGGYSTGTLTVIDSLPLYIYVGEEGVYADEKTIFGGGGAAESSSTYNSGSGGGASDIRIGTDSLYSRVIVAGGGGGGAGAGETTYSGGAGGCDVHRTGSGREDRVGTS